MACCDWKVIALSQLSYTSYCTANGTCSSCKELSALEAQIHGTISNLQGLLQRHQSKKTELNHTHSRIIQRLPPEVMSTIFHFCSPVTFRNQLESERYEDVFASLYLGGVCRTWRHLAWATPQLWTHLVILRPFFNRPERVSLVLEWISRSKALPLSIYVSVYENEKHIDGGPPPSHRPLLDALSACSARWRDVDLKIPTHFLRYLFQRVHDLDRIDTLRLRPGITSRREFRLFDGVIPSPHRVVASGLLLKQLNLDWSRVIQAKADDFSVEDCLELFRCAPVLEMCELVEVGYSMSFSALSPFVHENLKNLSFDSIDTGEDFFSAITLPNLTHFSYDKHGHRCDNPALLPFFLRSTPPLQKLELLNVEFSFEDLEALLQAVPTVSHLHLTMSPDLYDHDERKQFRDPFLRHLSQSPTDILPALRTLEFSFHVYDHVELPWKCIAGIVAPLLANDDDPRCRPLKTFRHESSTSKFYIRKT
ncbi:hypothetical protein D9613_004537 [Agrocybe pediades]|uniref:F-box domain-containing protein n=1 Tax=Agrocybe pediades TaxID=84607 RepID=A0A8H4QJK9_9AGAR|nr:hypothetical protein D9613_004537 [Agrocybe pediades]